MEFVELEKLITTNLKLRNVLRTKVLRDVKQSVINLTKTPTFKGKITSDTIDICIRKIVKELNEEVQSNFDVGRDPDQQLHELHILNEYIEQPLSEEETSELIVNILSGIEGGFNMGKVMKELKSSGKLIDMKLASQLINKLK